MDRIARAADRIASARLSGAPFDAFDETERPRDLAEGYAVQEASGPALAAWFGPPCGYKIGCTSAVMQDYLRISHPCSGRVFARGVHRSGARLPFDDYLRVGVECEIAVLIGEDLPATDAPLLRETVARAVETLHPAIEIVDDRYVRWESLDAPTLVADDFFAAGIVLGDPVRPEGLDLLAVTGRALVNGVEAGRGTGADVLGHPYDALAWLAGHLASRGTALRRGDIVMTGSVVKTIWLTRGDVVRMEFSALGSCEASFA